MGETFIGVRGVNEEEFRKFRARAVAKKKKVGEALTNLIVEDNNEDEEKSDPRVLPRISGIIKTKEVEKNLAKELLKSKPIKVGKRVRWSEEVDEILYGMKK